MRNRHRETEKGTILTVKDFRCKFLTIFFRNHRNTDIEIQKYNICGILWQKEMKIQKYKNTKQQDAKKQKYIDAEYKFRIQREYNAEKPFLFMSVELEHLHSLIGLVWLWPILASPTPYPTFFSIYNSTSLTFSSLAVNLIQMLRLHNICWPNHQWQNIPYQACAMIPIYIYKNWISMFSERIIGNILIVTVIVTVREALKKGNTVKFENLNQVVVIYLISVSPAMLLCQKVPNFTIFPFWSLPPFAFEAPLALQNQAEPGAQVSGRGGRGRGRRMGVAVSLPPFRWRDTFTF